jgi:hypothetical protein
MIGTLLGNSVVSDVKAVLTKDKASRDSNLRLFTIIAEKQLLTSHLYQSNKNCDFGYHMANGLFYDYESVARASRFLQRKHEELRGDNWKPRQIRAVKFRNEINK